MSESERRFLERERVVRSGRLRLLGRGSVCGVDLTRFNPCRFDRQETRTGLGFGKADKVILYVGRINRDKGVLDLARSFASLASPIPDDASNTSNAHLHLIFVGPDEQDLTPELRDICSHVLNRLQIHPYTSEPERFMGAADVLCLPSYREGFGMVLLEAAAMGLPTVASDIYGIQDAIEDGHTGLLFPAGDVEALGKSLLRVLGDAALAERLGMRGQARVREHFSSQRVLSELSLFYEKTLTDSLQGSAQR